MKKRAKNVLKILSGISNLVLAIVLKAFLIKKISQYAVIIHAYIADRNPINVHIVQVNIIIDQMSQIN